jgi:hypothetical protein
MTLDLLYALLIHPQGSPADIAAHVVVGVICGAPVVGVFWSTAPWWRGDA